MTKYKKTLAASFVSAIAIAGLTAPPAQASSDLTYNAPGTVDLLTSQKITGNLTVGNQLSGRTIYLERREGQHWERIFTGTTGSNGYYQFPIPSGFYYEGILRTHVTSAGSGNPRAFSGQQPITVDAGDRYGDKSEWDSIYTDGARRQLDPAKTIRYRINLANAPINSTVADTQQAFQMLFEASGVKSSYKGTTSADPRNVNTWPSGTDVVVGWKDLPCGDSGFTGCLDLHQATPTVNEFGDARTRVDKAGLELATGAYFNFNDNGTRHWDPGFQSDYPSYDQSDGGKSLGGTLIHELGHLAGLEHVPATGAGGESQAMTSGEGNKIQRYNDGDLEGMYRLGRIAGNLTPTGSSKNY